MPSPSQKLATPDAAYQAAKLKGLKGLRGLRISENFTWLEAFGKCTEAELQSFSFTLFKNVAHHAKTMEMVRSVFGRPITVTSWVRSKRRNSLVGGSDTSFHLFGLATDFVVQGFETVAGNLYVQKTLDVLPFMQKCELEWTNGRWTHVATAGRRLRPKA